MKNFKPIFMVFLFVTFGLLTRPNAAAEDIFLDWNHPDNSQFSWEGWKYCDGQEENCIGYSNPGWKREDFILINSTPLPRSFRKNDYDNDSLALLDTEFLPPSRRDGASLKVFDTGKGTRYQPSWWLWESSQNLSAMGITTDSSDRLSVYVYLKGIDDIKDPNTDGYTFAWGTYTCWEGGGYSGESCPKESDNGHFYHSATVAPNMWVHILFDEHPYHQRSISRFPPNNPTLISDGKDYFSHLYKMYFQFSQPVKNPNTSAFWIDELKFTSAAELGEPNQNDESISTLWVGFQPKDGRWEIGWNDLSVNGSNDKEYEIRWSIHPITNDNFNSAHIVQPLDKVVNGNHLHKVNTWKMQLWTRFDLPFGAEWNDKIYFAVKDVSVEGGLYTAPPNSFIHTIDYVLPKVASPANVRVLEK